MAEQMKFRFTAIARRWRDKVNGNTYHSVRIIDNRTGKVITAPFQYGYGTQYQQSALEEMVKAGWLPQKYTRENAYLYERENNYPIQWEVSDGLKRDVVANALPEGVAQAPRRRPSRRPRLSR